MVCNRKVFMPGHCLLGTHARRLCLSNLDYCRSCKQADAEENIEHFLRFCPAHNIKRFQALGSYTLSNLAAIQDLSIPKLLCFLKITNWFEKPIISWAREKDLYRNHMISQGGLSGGLISSPQPYLPKLTMTVLKKGNYVFEGHYCYKTYFNKKCSANICVYWLCRLWLGGNEIDR